MHLFYKSFNGIKVTFIFSRMDIDEQKTCEIIEGFGNNLQYTYGTADYERMQFKLKKPLKDSYLLNYKFE